MTGNNLSRIISKIKEKASFPELFQELYPDHYEGRSSLCPFHDDNRNSFQIDAQRGYCHAGCRPGDKYKSYDVISLWMQAKGVSFKQAVEQLAERCGIPMKTAKSVRAQITATYDYADEHGRLLYQCVRYEPKTFKQRRPDENGGWIWNLSGIQCVLYRLPNILKADEIWMCEGERDADSLSDLGLCGTTTPLGAGKWPKLCADHKIHEYLRGKRVLICPDNDEPGRKHARDIANKLHGFATSVKIINMPGLSEKSDVSDFIEKHGPEKAKVELLKIAEKTPEYEPSVDAAEPESEHLTDSGNSKRLARHVSGKIKFCRALGGYYAYDGTRWAPDQLSHVQAAAKQIASKLYREAANIEDGEVKKALEKWAHTSESAAKIKAMIELLMSEPDISVLPDVFDGDPLLLNVLNGTLDLRTGELRLHDSADLISKSAPVVFDPTATCPLWERFIQEITEDDDELAQYIQRLLGYSLMGLTNEQCWFFLYGKGRNGKGALLHTMKHILGEYAISTPQSTFMEKRNESEARNDIARLRGARFIFASEPKDRRFNAELLKQFTGEDEVTARFHYREFFDFKPEGKIFISANSRPEVKDTSEGFWERIHLIPFNRQFLGENRDKSLEDKLKAEASGILNWMLEGLKAWQQTGLNPPEKVRLAVQDYRQDADRLGDFIDKHCVIHTSATVPVSELYKMYSKHCECIPEKPLKRRDFNENLLARAGISKGKAGPSSKRVATWFGIGLRADCEGENVIPGNFSREQRSCETCDIPPTVCVVPPDRRDASTCEYYS